MARRSQARYSGRASIRSFWTLCYYHLSESPRQFTVVQGSPKREEVCSYVHDIDIPPLSLGLLMTFALCSALLRPQNRFVGHGLQSPPLDAGLEGKRVFGDTSLSSHSSHNAGVSESRLIPASTHQAQTWRPHHDLDRCQSRTYTPCQPMSFTSLTASESRALGHVSNVSYPSPSQPAGERHLIVSLHHHLRHRMIPPPHTLKTWST